MTPESLVRALPWKCRTSRQRHLPEHDRFGAYLPTSLSVAKAAAAIALESQPRGTGTTSTTGGVGLRVLKSPLNRGVGTLWHAHLAKHLRLANAMLGAQHRA